MFSIEYGFKRQSIITIIKHHLTTTTRQSNYNHHYKPIELQPPLQTSHKPPATSHQPIASPPNWTQSTPPSTPPVPNQSTTTQSKPPSTLPTANQTTTVKPNQTNLPIKPPLTIDLWNHREISESNKEQKGRSTNPKGNQRELEKAR